MSIHIYPVDIHGVYYAVVANGGKGILVPPIPDLMYTTETETVGSYTGSLESLPYTLAEREFELIIPAPLRTFGKIITKIKTYARNTAAANENDKYRVKVEVLCDGKKTGEGIGNEHAPNNTNLVGFDDLIVIDLGSVSLTAGAKLKIKYIIEYVAQDPTNPGIEVHLKHDPLSDTDKLVIYLQMI